MRVRKFLCALAMCAGLAEPAAAGEGLTLEVGEEIYLKAEDVFLRQVLIEFSERVPFTLIESGEALDQPVSFDFEASSWEDAISALLRGEGYTLTTDAVTGQPKILVVVWNVVGEALAAAAAADDVEAQIRAAAERFLELREHAGEAVDAVAAVEAARFALRQAQSEGSANVTNLETAQADYAEALRGLENFDDARAVEALLSALDEDDREVRLNALESLRSQSNAAANPAALAQVESALYTAEDPELERAALEVLVRYADPAEILPTLEGWALAEGPNQDLAVREWLRIREEQEVRARMEAEGDPQLGVGVKQP